MLGISLYLPHNALSILADFHLYQPTQDGWPSKVGFC